jgi:hypothetical protein
VAICNTPHSRGSSPRAASPPSVVAVVVVDFLTPF